MKHSNFIKNSIIALLPISLLAVVLFGVSTPVTGTEAYSGSSLPTTIRLNDPSESSIRNYYANLNTLSTNERKGNNLLKNLKTILSNGQKYYNYDSGDIVWKMYEITDRDWDKSPAGSDSVGSYDPVTNTISNYVYGSNSNHKNNPYIRAYYMDREQENVAHAWGNHNQDATGINREHLWAKAQGFDGEGGAAAGARGDPMHLVAANGYANNVHSNNFYGYVDKTRTYADVSEKYSTLGHNYSGYSKTYPQSSNTVFEPQDCDKGDIARAIFYMAARYNNIAGKSASQESFDADNPNLLLTNDLTKWSQKGYTSSATSPGYHGLITDLLEWNKIDPPDEYEIHRNNLLYTNFTNNRNPFIDFPEWADICWGDSASSADPVSDSLNGKGSTKTLKSISVTSQPSKTIYTEGEDFSPKGMVITALYSDNSTSIVTDYTYSPSDELVLGTDKIVISYEGKTAEVPISVIKKGSSVYRYFEKVESNLTSGNYLIVSDEEGVAWKNHYSGSANTISIVVEDDKYIDYSNELGNALFTFNLEKGSVLAPTGKYIYQDADATGVKSSETPVRNIISLSDGVLSLEGSSGAKLWCNNNGNKPTFNFYRSALSYSDVNLYKLVEEVDVVHPTSITVTPSSATIEIGNSLSLTSNVLPLDTTNKSVTWSSNNINVATVDQSGRVSAVGTGTAVITATSNDTSSVSGSCTISVPQPIVLNKLQVTGDYKTVYYVGEDFDKTNMIVNAIYTQGGQQVKVENVIDEVEFSGFNSSISGLNTVTVTYNDKSTTFDLDILDIPVEENTVKIIATTYGLENQTKVTSLSKDNFEVTFNKGTNSVVPTYYTNGSAVRVYSGNSFKITGPHKIVGVSIVFSNSDGSNEITVDKGYWNEITDKWSNETSVDDLTFTIGGSSGHRKIAEIHIKYDPDSTTTKELLSISLGGDYPTEFFVGETFSYEGLEVTAHYNDGSEDNVLPTSVTGAHMDVADKQEITVSYTENAITKTATYTINVLETILLDHIVLSGDYPTEFFVGDPFDRTDLVVTAYYTDENYKIVTPTSISGYDMNTPSESQTITVSYIENEIEASATYEIKVKDILPEELEITYVEQQDYVVGDSFNDNVVALLTYNNGDTKNVNPTNISGYDMSQSGKQTVTVEYSEKGVTVEDFYDIEIDKLKPVSMEISGNFKKSFFVGDTFTHDNLVAKVLFNNGKNEIVTPEFSAPDMTTAGKKTITVSYSLNEVTVSKDYEITVELVVPTKIELSGNYKTSFFAGDSFTYEGLVVTATYNNGKFEKVTPTVTAPNMNTAGKKTVQVSYEYNNVKVTKDYEITVIAVVPESLKITKNPIKTEYFAGETFTSEGLEVTCVYNNKTENVVTPIISGYDMSKPGKQTVKLTYVESGVTVETSYTINVTKVVPVSINLSGNYPTEFYVGHEFSSEGLVVTATYNDGSTKVVTPTKISGYNMSSPGNQTVVVSYTEDGKTVSASYKITVLKVELEKIELSGNYKKEYNYGDKFSSEGLIVTAFYNDGTNKVVKPSSIGGYSSFDEGKQTITVAYIEGSIEKEATYEITLKGKPTPEPAKSDNKGLIIGAAVGGVVVVGGLIAGISIGVHKKHKRKVK